MKRVNSGQTVTCQGQDLLVACQHAGDDIEVTVFNSSGAEIPVRTQTTSGAFTLPGHAGLRYRVVYVSGAVDVSGSHVIAA